MIGRREEEVKIGRLDVHSPDTDLYCKLKSVLDLNVRK